MNHMTTHFPGYGDMGGQHTGPGPGSPAQQQQQQQQQMGPGGPVDVGGMNGGFRGMQQQQQQQPGVGPPGGGMFQPGPGPMEPQQQQRSMMGSNAHMAGGQVVTNNLQMNGSSMSLGPGSGGGGGGPMNGMMNMMQQQPPQPPQQQQQPGGGVSVGVMQQQQQQQPQMMPNPHMGVHMGDGSGNGGQINVGNGGGGGGGGVRACAGCGGKILERFLFHALDRFWHHGCLKCSCCGARLADIGVSCYTKAGMILCRTDYVRYSNWVYSNFKSYFIYSVIVFFGRRDALSSSTAVAIAAIRFRVFSH